MVNEFEIKKQICDIGRRIYNRNMVAANERKYSVNSMTMSSFAHLQVYLKDS